MKKKVEDSKYTVLGPDDLWKFYASLAGLYRGGGNTTNPKPKTGAQRVQQGSTNVTAGAEDVAQEGLRMSGFPAPKKNGS